MNQVEQRKAARSFVERWQAAEGSEDREARSFWIELCQNVLSIANPTTVLDFERKVKGRKIDVFFEDVGILIENKSRGVSLDEAEQRGWYDKAKTAPRMVTPFEQAKWYADNITPRSIAPKWVITCNFDEIRIYDLDKDDAEKDFESIALVDIPNLLHRFSFFTRKENSRLEREKQLSIKAGEVVGRLYDAFSKAYLDIENDEREQRSLNILITRIVFLLYAEDADLLQEHNAFYEYLRGFQVHHMRQALIDLFAVLKTPVEERDPYLDPNVAAFPYVNGGLFEQDIIIPQFDIYAREILLNEASAEFDWSDISPTIFGAVFESTLNPETRRSGGMHYTSVENIHKVTGPLFYDALKDELTAIEGLKSRKERDFKLQAFRKKIASLKILDPACGSGNFLTETYISLRKLENRVLENLYGDQMAFGLMDPIQVSIEQFYGIEINDFAVEVAKTALWIAELQMLDETREILNMWIDALPLKSNDNIHEGNALRMDWNDVLPASKCSYIIGNPPFVGSSWCSKEQKAEIVGLFGKNVKRSSSIDYVSAWYYKTCQMMQDNPAIRAALVSTNSITQGEQVAPLWGTLIERFGVHIDFAWRTFVWDSEATDRAHVHCVIIGFSCGGWRGRKTLYSPNGTASIAGNINPYLYDAPNTIVESRPTQISGAPRITLGNKPVDGGNYVFKPAQKDEFLRVEPQAKPYFHAFLGSSELINARERYCLYVGNLTSDEIDSMPLVKERVEAVRTVRAKSTSSATRKAAETPQRFFFECIPTEAFIAIPEVSSQRRVYLPVAYLDPEVMVSNKLLVVQDAGLYELGVLMSLFHNAWMRVVTGRLKSDYQYSNAIVYNNYVWPNPSAEQRERIEACTQAVLDERSAHPGDSLATLYDPDKMPADLLAAHKALDAAVEAAYGVDFGGDEEKIVAHLFKLYAEKTADER